VRQKSVRVVIWQRPEGKDGDRLFEFKDRVFNEESSKKLEGIEPVKWL
jgi:hypothetical protein